TMNAGSIGEIPPSTRGSPGATSPIAIPVAVARSANLSQPGSISGSQCDLLFGSFQIIAASIMVRPPRRIAGSGAKFRIGTRRPPADVNLLFRTGDDFKTRAPQHGLGTGAIGYPPIGPVIRVFMLDEMEFRIIRIVEMTRGPEIVIGGHRFRPVA